MVGRGAAVCGLVDAARILLEAVLNVEVDDGGGVAHSLQRRKEKLGVCWAPLIAAAGWCADSSAAMLKQVALCTTSC